METVKAGRTKSYLLLAALLLGFLGMLAAFGPALYNDSDQYIRMHIHREQRHLRRGMALCCRRDTKCAGSSQHMVFCGVFVQEVLFAFVGGDTCRSVGNYPVSFYQIFFGTADFYTQLRDERSSVPAAFFVFYHRVL